MKDDEKYKNGQAVYEQIGDELIYYFQDGEVKARGTSIDGVMQGEWIFNRQGGMLWQVGNFKDGKKDGEWKRYDKHGNLEYHAIFSNGTIKERMK